MKYRFGRKMSNQFKTIMYEEDGRDYFEVTGSPADIRKMMRVAEEYGFIPFFAETPVMREGRKYGLRFIDGIIYFYFFRAA